MKRIVIISILFLLGAAYSNAGAQNTEYKATPVTISKDKVRNNGTLYYSHVVLEKQTLYSISKVYNVTLQEIYDANPALNLEKEGLKTYQILLIPIKEGVSADEQRQQEEDAAEPVVSSAPATAVPVTVQEKEEVREGTEYLIHTVKWFEDLNIIARKYGVSKEAIMKANGMTTPIVSRRQKIKIPVGIQTGDEQETVTAAEETEEKSIFETIGDVIAEKAEEIFSPGKKDITAALLLPFNAQKQPNDNHLDFYSGVLMAVRDLSNEGINTELRVFDTAGGAIPATEEALNTCDFVLGPISSADLTSALKICDASTPVISPLEPKAAELASSHPNFVQAPGSIEAQGADMVEWLKKEFKQGDKIILFTEKGTTRTAAAAALANSLAESGLSFSTISYGLLEGKDIASNLESQASPGHTLRLVVASESEAFVSDVVRNANLLAHRKLDIALYCTSKVRSFETIEVESLHNTNLHTSISYFIDYDSADVKKFVKAYRALFNTEPGPFAFQGYDTARYFISMTSKYGKHWTDNLVWNEGNGLQSDFKFERAAGGGHVNTAVRRVLYGPDFTISLCGQ